ncbi:hypothetical protein BH10PSE12_BH10PSE12_18870 [soil metagenome]
MDHREHTHAAAVASFTRSDYLARKARLDDAIANAERHFNGIAHREIMGVAERIDVDTADRNLQSLLLSRRALDGAWAVQIAFQEESA